MRHTRVPQYKRDMHMVEKVEQRTKKIIKGLECLSYEGEAERAGIVWTGEEKAERSLSMGVNT